MDVHPVTLLSVFLKTPGPGPGPGYRLRVFPALALVSWFPGSWLRGSLAPGRGFLGSWPLGSRPQVPWPSRPWPWPPPGPLAFQARRAGFVFFQPERERPERDRQKKQPGKCIQGIHQPLRRIQQPETAILFTPPAGPGTQAARGLEPRPGRAGGRAGNAVDYAGSLVWNGVNKTGALYSNTFGIGV
ncbi:MAG: hypothetical protein HPY89_00695 [Pelotomaculum sp.]|nr:hypothetical protein [Pelotomaculum sp.]